MKERNTRGITLIALIITVIILLILAGTAISISINGGDLFGKAGQAREEWNAATQNEKNAIDNSLIYIDRYSGTPIPNLFVYESDGNGGVKVVGINYDFIENDNPKTRVSATEAASGVKIAALGETEFGLKIATNDESTNDTTDDETTSEDESEESAVYVLTDPKGALQSYTWNLVIPATVKLNEYYEYDENGTTYNVTTIENLGENEYVTSEGWQDYDREANETFGQYISDAEGSNNSNYNQSDFITMNVTIQNGVTNIGEFAFYACRGLQSITIPNSVTRIEEYAFAGCSGLKKIDLPNNLTYIGETAFSGCNSLKNVTIPDSVTSMGDQVFIATEGLTSIKFGTGLTTLPDNTCSKCPNLQSVIISEGTETVGKDAFFQCGKLTNVSLPTSLRTIDRAAFDRTGITNIVIPEGVTTIKDSFDLCESLTTITLPSTLTKIDEYAFNSLYTHGTPLKTINFRGTQAQWEAVDKEDLMDYLPGCQVNYGTN